MSGAVVNCVNIRLNAETIAFLLEHSIAEVVMVDQEFFTLAEESLKIIAEKKASAFRPPILIVIGDPTCDPKSLQYALGKGAIEYEEFLKTGDPEFNWKPPKDEWQSIALGYTSGTTSSPKGVVLHHRGAYLMALSVAIVWGMPEGAIFCGLCPCSIVMVGAIPGRWLRSVEQAYVFARYANHLCPKCIYELLCRVHLILATYTRLFGKKQENFAYNLFELWWF
jgi:acyl-CoA synthetase (AMP-forming)/AMP-acid ligase II